MIVFLPNIPKEDNSILIISANFKRVNGNFCKKENFSRNTFIVVCDTAFGVSLLRVEDESLTKKSLPIREPDFQNDLFHCYCKMMDDVLEFVNVEDCVGVIAEHDGNEEYIVGDEDNVDDASCDSGCCCMCLFYSKN